MAVSLTACSQSVLGSDDDSEIRRGPLTSSEVIGGGGSISSQETSSQENDADDGIESALPGILQDVAKTVSKPQKEKPAEHKHEENKESSEEESEPEKKEESSEESSEESKAESKKASDVTYDEVAEDGTFVYNGVTISLPAGYSVKSNDDDEVLTVPGNYPYTNQNVTFTSISGGSERITREELDSTYQGVLEGYSGCKDFTEYTIDGYDAQYFTFDVNMQDLQLNMAQLAVYLDRKCVIITFTSEVSEDFSVLKKAADSVRIE